MITRLKASRGKLPVFLLTIGLAVCSSALARFGNTLTDELRVFTDSIAAQCTSVKEQLKTFNVNADPLTGHTLKDAVQSLCVCMPAKTQALTATQSPEDLAREVTEAEVLSLFNSAIIDKCAAEQMQAMYGDQCRERFKKAAIKARTYCPCMKEEVGGYTDAMAAAIAAAASDYLPLAAEAEKNGEPVPARPPILEAYYQADQRCKG